MRIPWLKLRLEDNRLIDEETLAVLVVIKPLLVVKNIEIEGGPEVVKLCLTVGDALGVLLVIDAGDVIVYVVARRSDHF